MGLMQWYYRGGHPNRVARMLNRVGTAISSLGVAPNYWVTLEVVGRHSGRPISLPLVMVRVDGERYLVSMLGAETNWVRNVRAAGGKVILRHGRREAVCLEEVMADRRAPVLKRYLQRAPGARPHLPIDKDAALAEFARVSPQFPVFRVVPRNAASIQQPSKHAVRPGACSADHKARCQWYAPMLTSGLQPFGMKLPGPGSKAMPVAAATRTADTAFPWVIYGVGMTKRHVTASVSPWAYEDDARRSILPCRWSTAMECRHSHPRWWHSAITIIKVIHSAIFLANSISIVHIFWAGVRNRPSRWTGLALAAALGESAVFVVNRGRCPLTTLVEYLGAESGRVSDIFLPRWFADRIP